jgi:uncharacterized membrane protein YhaH (DUF805 family)
MSAPALDGWFSPSLRRNRKSFVLAVVALLSVLLVCLMGVNFFSKTDSGSTLYFWAFTVPGIICTYLLTAQRLRDMNITGWLALLWIPLGVVDQNFSRWASLLALFLLAVIPGTRGPNRYGPDPLGHDERS